MCQEESKMTLKLFCFPAVLELYSRHIFTPHEDFTRTPSTLLSVPVWVFINPLTLQISDSLSVTRPVWHTPLVLLIQRGWSGEWSDSNTCGGQSYHLNRTVSVMSSQGCGWQAWQEMHIMAENNSDVHNVTLLFQCLNIHRSNTLTSEVMPLILLILKTLDKTCPTIHSCFEISSISTRKLTRDDH